MRCLAISERAIVLFVLVGLFACLAQGQAEPKVIGNKGRATQTLQHYIQLRLQDADWKEYSKFITWPDEPSWDCKWVARKDRVGAAIRKGQKVVIPVAYSRLGLFCFDFNFKPEPELVTINYELVKRAGGWKVDAPIPDYPDIDADVLIRSLNATAEDANETPERRAEAAATTRKLREALNPDTQTSQKPQGD
jgi:hypothetical protein